jgi:hypothetical protein
MCEVYTGGHFMGTAKRVLIPMLLTAIVLTSSVCAGLAQGSLFDVRISSRQTTFTQGTPVLVEATVVNHAQSLLVIHDPRCGPIYASITVRDENQQLLEPRDEWRPRPDTIPCGLGAMIRPSTSNSFQLNIARWFDVSRAGRYFIQMTPTASFEHDVRQTEKSNVLEIQIAAMPVK